MDKVIAQALGEKKPGEVRLEIVTMSMFNL